MSRRARRLALTASILAGALLLGSDWAIAALGGASGVVIPYSGTLEKDGVGVTGARGFTVEVHNQATGGTACFTTPSPIQANVARGAFSFVVAGVPESCVAGREVWLAIRVHENTDVFQLNPRQRAYPVLAALTSGPGDFNVGNSIHLGYVDNTQGTHVVWNRTPATGSTNFINHRGLGAGGFTFDQTNNGTSIQRLVTIDAEGNEEVGSTFTNGLRLGRVGVGSDGKYMGVARTNHLNGNDYALLQEDNGETYVNSAPGRPLHLRINNTDVGLFDTNGKLTVTGAITANGSGGNVPNRCVTRVSSTYNVACQADEIAMGGGARCPSLWRLIESGPWNGPGDGDVPSDGAQARGWRSVCQVWGSAGATIPPYYNSVICCRQ